MKKSGVWVLLLCFLVVMAGTVMAQGKEVAGVSNTQTIQGADTREQKAVFGLSGWRLENYQGQAFTTAVSQELDAYVSLLQQGGITSEEGNLIGMATAFKSLLPQYQELWGTVQTGGALYFSADGTMWGTTNITGDQWIYNSPAVYLGSGSAQLCTWSRCFFAIDDAGDHLGGGFVNTNSADYRSTTTVGSSSAGFGTLMDAKVKSLIDKNGSGNQTFLIDYSAIGQTTTAAETQTGVTKYSATLTEDTSKRTYTKSDVVTNQGGTEMSGKTQSVESGNRLYDMNHTITYNLLGQSTENRTVTGRTFNYTYFDEGCTAFCSSPLVLDMDNDGKLLASQGKWNPHPGNFDKSRIVPFDFFGTGFPVVMEWVGPHDGLLCVPKADGTVDGTDLFGVAEGYSDGYAKLTLWDKNNDHKLTGKELDGLHVWQDLNQNGKADQGEVTSVVSNGITQMNLTSQRGVGSFIMNGKSRFIFDWWPTMTDSKKVGKQ